MTREEKIYSIKNIIRDFGEFDTKNLNVKAIYQNMGGGRRRMLESFADDNVEVVNYLGNSRKGVDYLSYEDLSDDDVDEILTMSQLWENKNLKYRDRNPGRGWKDGRDWKDWGDWRDNKYNWGNWRNWRNRRHHWRDWRNWKQWGHNGNDVGGHDSNNGRGDGRGRSIGMDI